MGSIHGFMGLTPKNTKISENMFFRSTPSKFRRYNATYLEQKRIDHFLTLMSFLPFETNTFEGNKK